MPEQRQSEHAIKFYEGRSFNYDDSCPHHSSLPAEDQYLRLYRHADFTKRFISHVDIKPGQHVLDLACGTGLLSFLEADAVGPNGEVIGIDVTPGMLAIAAEKKSQAGDRYANLDFAQGDVLRLEEAEVVQGKTFDVITVASALVLFPDPKAAIEHWTSFLKPGGIIALDATHPRNLVPGMVLERVARRLDLPVPYNREWSRSESTLKDMLESAGVKTEKVVSIENQSGYGRRFYDLDQWDDFFVENVIVKDVVRTFANNDIRRKAQKLYKEEWEKLAIDGKVEEVDTVFLGIASKPSDGSRFKPQTFSNRTVFTGGCRCGEIQYTSAAPPSDIIICHCRACQQLSGSGYLPFVNVTPKAEFKYKNNSSLKTIRLSNIAERTFCSACGTPITMAYDFEPEHLAVTVASIDFGTLNCAMPKVKKHIYVQEKAPWVMLPEDGVERWGTSEFAHRLST